MEQNHVPPPNNKDIDDAVNKAVDRLKDEDVERFVESEFGRMAPGEKTAEQQMAEKMDRIASQSFTQRNLMEAQKSRGELSPEMIDKMVRAEIEKSVFELQQINPQMSDAEARQYLQDYKRSFEEMVDGEQQRDKKLSQKQAVDAEFMRRAGHAEKDAKTRAEIIEQTKAEAGDMQAVREFLQGVNEAQFRSSPDFPSEVRKLVLTLTEDENRIAGIESHIYEQLEAKYPKQEQKLDLGGGDLSDEEIDDIFK